MPPFCPPTMLPEVTPCSKRWTNGSAQPSQGHANTSAAHPL